MEGVREGSTRGVPGSLKSFPSPVLPADPQLQRFTPQFLLMRLKHATTSQDEASEALASSFVQGAQADPSNPSISRDVDEFVKEFRELRKTYHKRVIWGDRWTAGQVP